MNMRNDRSVAESLRLQGLSYKEISEKLGVPKSTLSGWFISKEWSDTVKKELEHAQKAKSKLRMEAFNAVRAQKLSDLYKKARLEAEKEFHAFKTNPLFISGVSVYWGEGDKRSLGQVRISNIDPQMMALFRDFLVFCGVDPVKLRAWLLLYQDLNEKECKDFWIKNGLKSVIFNKSIVIQGRHKVNRVSFGVCNLGFSSRYFKEKMIIWLRLLPKEVLGGRQNTRI